MTSTDAPTNMPVLPGEISLHLGTPEYLAVKHLSEIKGEPSKYVTQLDHLSGKELENAYNHAHQFYDSEVGPSSDTLLTTLKNNANRLGGNQELPSLAYNLIAFGNFTDLFVMMNNALNPNIRWTLKMAVGTNDKLDTRNISGKVDYYFRSNPDAAKVMARCLINGAQRWCDDRRFKRSEGFTLKGKDPKEQEAYMDKVINGIFIPPERKGIETRNAWKALMIAANNPNVKREIEMLKKDPREAIHPFAKPSVIQQVTTRIRN